MFIKVKSTFAAHLPSATIGEAKIQKKSDVWLFPFFPRSSGGPSSSVSFHFFFPRKRKWRRTAAAQSCIERDYNRARKIQFAFIHFFLLSLQFIYMHE